MWPTSRDKRPKRWRCARSICRASMNTPAGWQIEDRSRRHVRRTRLCVHPGAPRHRLVSTIEEALRLAALPGENEGRTYYFRRLRLAGLPADGDRRAWLDAFQCALTKI